MRAFEVVPGQPAQEFEVEVGEVIEEEQVVVVVDAFFLQVVFYGMSFSLMTIAVKKIDMSVSYAIWSGVGTALIALIGIAWFKEPLTTLKIVSIALIVAGVFGLNAIVRAS